MFIATFVFSTCKYFNSNMIGKSSASFFFFVLKRRQYKSRVPFPPPPPFSESERFCSRALLTETMEGKLPQRVRTIIKIFCSSYVNILFLKTNLDVNFEKMIFNTFKFSNNKVTALKLNSKMPTNCGNILSKVNIYFIIY